MNVLYATGNGHLRSTTSSLNAIVRELKPRGVQPTFLFTRPGPWQEVLAREGWTTVVWPLVIPDKHRPVQALRQVWSLVRFLRRHRIAIVHCNEHELYPALRHAAYWAGVPILTSLHWNLEDRGYADWAFASPYTPAALQFLSRAQMEASRRHLPPGFPPDRVKLLMSGLHLDQFLAQGGDGQALRAAWGADDKTVVLGTASAIKPRKHLEDFVAVISRLRKSGRPVIGVMAGGGGAFEDGAYRAELEARIDREGLRRHCLMIGNLDPVTPFFRAIDIGVNPSEMEILSMSMCEAMACGRPMLAYAVGGNPETVHDPWCVVPFGDVDALTERAARLVDDPAFRKSMGEAATRYVRSTFDAPVLANRQARIYREVLGARVNEVWPEANRSGQPDA